MKEVRDVGGQHGYDPRVSYSLPAGVEAGEAARTWLAEMRGAIDQPARHMLADWLIALGTATAGKPGETEAKAKIATYAMVIDAPAYWFTAATLRAACRHFKWFPSVAELTEFLRRQCREQDEQVSLARRLADRSALASIKARA